MQWTLCRFMLRVCRQTQATDTLHTIGQLASKTKNTSNQNAKINFIASICCSALKTVCNDVTFLEFFLYFNLNTIYLSLSFILILTFFKTEHRLNIEQHIFALKKCSSKKKTHSMGSQSIVNSHIPQQLCQHTYSVINVRAALTDMFFFFSLSRM